MCLQSLMKFHHCLFKILKKKTNVVDKTLTELAPSPYFSIINVHLVDIDVFAKSHEIQSLPVQVIKEKNEMSWIKTWQILWNSIIAFSRYWKTKMSWTDGLTDDNVKRVYPPQTQEFSDPFRRITRIGYDMKSRHQTTCSVVNSITIANCASLFNCMTEVLDSDLMMALFAG